MKEGKMMQDTTQSISQKRPRDTRQAHRRANAIFLKIAGGPLRAYSALKHVGRSSGREYVTPLSAYPLGDGFVLALLYGDAQRVDWCRNVMAAGQCRLLTRGREYVLERPEILSAEQALPALPLLMRLLYRAQGIQQFLWVHRKA
jgi:hypothetical protein